MTYLSLYSRYELRTAGIFFVTYVCVYAFASQFIPASAQINPAPVIAMCVLFFTGIRLWPFVYVSALAASALTGMSWLALFILPLATTIEAIVGAYLLRASKVDPLFRRYRDMFYLMATTAVISLILPTFVILATTLRNTTFTFDRWAHAYVASAFCFLIITPFILRWFAKPRFSRTPIEIVETTIVFGVLIAINYVLFVQATPSLYGIPLVYVLFIPLFLIALRLRPRFITLALVITSLFSIAGVLMYTKSEMLATPLFLAEVFLIVIAIIFFIIASLEEDRRVNTNLMHSQLATLENAIARVSSESRAKNDFIAILSHELRNPLAPIMSAIDLLKIKGSRDKDEEEALDIMADRMGVVRRLLDDLLDVSRISEGKIMLRQESVELQSVLKRAVLSTNHHRKELHQHFVFKLPKEPLYVLGDPMRLEQIFSNLLTNASKYSNSGDTVTVTARQQDGIAEIEVADEGVGLSSHGLESIFLPFNQVEQGERSSKGLGIGLALVRSFVDMHGGSVEAKSPGKNQGSRFIVRLPVLLTRTLSMGGKTTRRPTRTTLKIKSKLLVLVVDDNDAAAGGIGRLLELQGATVAYAYNGRQAIESAMSLRPDVVLLDVGLPDQDGYSVAKELRGRGFKGRLIALSGYSANEAKERGKDAGFEHYLVKPAGLADLRRVLPEL